MVLAVLIVFITPINNQLLWFFTSLNAAEVTASSTLHLQLSPSPAYALITICIFELSTWEKHENPPHTLWAL